MISADQHLHLINPHLTPSIRTVWTCTGSATEIFRENYLFGTSSLTRAGCVTKRKNRVRNIVTWELPFRRHAPVWCWSRYGQDSAPQGQLDRKSTRLNSSHSQISY